MAWLVGSFSHSLESGYCVLWYSVLFCRGRNGCGPCTHWYWQRQGRSTFCSWSEKWWRLWEVVFQGGFLSQSSIYLSKAVPAAPHGSLPFTAGSCTVPGSRAVDFRWPSKQLGVRQFEGRGNDLRERALALMHLGPVLSIVKFFVKHFLCQLESYSEFFMSDTWRSMLSF